MATKINWCDEVLEVTGGCTKCSPGCQNCWALKNVWRMAHKKSLAEQWGGLVEKVNGKLEWTGEIKLFPKALESKKLRGSGKRIFVDSKCDLFHEKVPFEFISDAYLMTMKKCPQYKFMLLTKRVKRMAQFFSAWCDYPYAKNVWPGATICNQQEADRIIPILLQMPGKHWISFEPLLGEIDFYGEDGTFLHDFWQGLLNDGISSYIDYAVIGCESGPKRRPCKREWIKSLYDQCKAAGVKVMVKQMEIDGKVCHDPALCEKRLR